MFWNVHFLLMSLLLFTLLTIDFSKLSAPLVSQDISYQITSFSLIHGLYFYSCPLWSSICLADFYHTSPARALFIGHIFPVKYLSVCLFVCLFVSLWEIDSSNSTCPKVNLDFHLKSILYFSHVSQWQRHLPR